MSEITQPHDTLFRRSMQEHKIARDFLRANLPAELLELLDLTTLTLANGDFVTEGLERLQNDCIYSCRIGQNDGYLILCMEHQSTAERMMAFRILRYTVAIMDSHLKQGHSELPIVVPMVLYHGTQSPYPYSTEIWDCFAEPELAKQWALKPFQLIDLTIIPDAQIKSHGLASVMEMLFKHAREEHVLGWLKSMLENGKSAIICSEIGVGYIKDIAIYLFNTCCSEAYPEERDQAITLLQEAAPEIGDEIMTWAEQFKQEGMQQGIQQGVQLGMQNREREIAKNLLLAGADVTLIKQSTGLSDEEIAALRRQQ